MHHGESGKRLTALPSPSPTSVAVRKKYLLDSFTLSSKSTSLGSASTSWEESRPVSISSNIPKRAKSSVILRVFARTFRSVSVVGNCWSSLSYGDVDVEEEEEEEEVVGRNRERREDMENAEAEYEEVGVAG